MILPGLSDKEILEELLKERTFIANEAKKQAKKAISRLQKQGRDGIDEKKSYPFDIWIHPLRNPWRFEVFVNMSKTPKWYHLAMCLTESEYGTKDYYFLRGLSNKKPYYIKITSHAVKRVGERFWKERCHAEDTFIGAIYALYFIQKGEVITWMKITDPKFLKFVLNSEDSSSITTLFYTYYGCYLGYETECGFVFKTFLNNHKDLKGDYETKALRICHYAHVLCNEQLYEKKYVEQIKEQADSIFHDYNKTMDKFNGYDIADVFKKIYKYKLLP